MSTYLVAFATGDFINKTVTAEDNTTIGVWAWNGPGMMDRITVATDTAVTCYNGLKKYINVTYPINKLDHLALPFFSYGGMENWGLIIYDSDPILFHNQEDTTAEKVFGIQVRCHEMAHQWFGDLVTNEWWSEIMLHESLADYFQTYSIGLMYPNQSSFASHLYVIETQEAIMEVDMYHPLIVYPDGTFDGITYDKGGSLLRQLHFTMNATGYQKALQNYLNAYQFHNADHNQFFEQFSIVAKDSGIKDWCGNDLNVSVLMNAWVNVPHYPAITVSLDDGGQSFVAGQQPFLPLAYLPPGYNYSWIIPTQVLEYEIPYAVNNYSTWILPNNTQCTNSPALKQEAVATYDRYDIYNEGAHTYARIIYEDRAHKRIRRIIEQDNGTISIGTKIRLISDEWATIDRDMVDLGLPPKLHRGLQILQSILTANTSVHSTTFMAAQNVIDSIVELSRDRHEFDLYLRFLKPILTNFYNYSGGWSGNDNDFNTGFLRASFLHYAVRFDIGDARQVALQFWDNYIVKNQTINPDIRRAVYCAAIWNDDGPVFEYTFIIHARSHSGSAVSKRAVYCAAIWNDDGPVFAKLSALFLQVESTGYYTAREINSLIQGMTCAQNATIINNIIDLFVNRSASQHRYKIYPALTNFYYNLAASDAMAEYLIKISNSSETWGHIFDAFVCVSLNSPCLLDSYLVGMTGLWYTDRRLEQFKTINSTICTNLKAIDVDPISIRDVISHFNSFYNNILLPANYRGQITYADMTRWLYDNYVPIGATPWMAQLNHTFTPFQYNLAVRPYFPSSYNYSIGKNFTFDANVTIGAVKFGATQTISFNSHRHMINHLRVFKTNGSIEVPWNSITRDYDNAIVTINLAQPIQAGTSILIVVNYTGLIDNNPGEGTYMNWDYLDYNKQKSWIFATDFEGGPSTRSLAPCYDEPHYKASWYVTVQYPTDMVALSNALEERTRNLGNGLSETTFKPTPKMASYLLAISVGDFAALRGKTNNNMLVRVWTWTGMQNNGELSLRAAIDTINYLSSTLNKSLPLEKLDVLALPQYSGRSNGAMENWGLIISGYLSCLWNPDYSTTAQLTDTYWTTSHETTHQWFGDLVTLDWWNYIFLNEGFATYWPTIVMSVTYPDQVDWAHNQRFNDAERSLRSDANLQSTRPIIVPASQLAGYCVFCYQSYEKASSLIHMIEQTIHRKNFDLALHNYLNAHEYNTAVDTDLFEKFTETAMNDYPNVYDWNGNPLNVTNYVRPFFYLQTFPLIKVVSSPDGYSYTYQQAPYIQNGLPNNTVFLWNIPLWTEPAQDYLPWLISQKSLNNDFPSGWNVVNPRRKVYARVWYDDPTWAPIQNQIQSNLTVFDPITRASFIADTHALANQQLVPWSRLLNLIKYAANVPELPTWGIVNSVFDDLLIRFKFQTADYSKLKTFILQILNANSQLQLLFNHTGNWASDLTSVFITEFSCYLGQSNCLSQASTSFNQFISNCQNSAYGTGRCNQVTPDHRPVQFCYGLRQNPNAASAVFNLVQWYINNAPLADYWRNDAVALLGSLSCLNDDNQVAQYLNLTLYDQLPQEFFQYVAETDSSGNRLFNFFNNNLQKIVDSRHFNIIASNLALGWSTSTQNTTLQNFNWQGVRLTNEQANAWANTVNGVVSNINWLAQNQPAISAWLNSNVS
uniref:Aminopeptidase N n=1 Tax=Acrobeloides nanus TaxID=290746 RepID=A0A914C2G0_9BILA